ncbi:ubiquinone-binding protein [Tardibacter chloracetimidivorans]|uniref:Ubiquinone-binding protein n=1 Tax=Tardibacter chloracetimidivorans TaxID=1921510 RepID=A0A1L3ZTI7_9SPHN|nr:type II toxin-antitoxin system RatA family toxin [Tardibacter chloracetimidivorans]API58956.1 ubiquinone-binding protein [Tardibacter chloracetimidivorans]
MLKHSETRELPYSPDQMFDLVSDIGSYAQFLPWVVGVRIRSRTEQEILADLLVGFGPLREKFTSRVTLDRPGSIDVEYIEGPMKYLHNDWRFQPDGKGGSIVDFNVEFAFRNRMLDTLAGRFFDEALRKMVKAFEARANKLYAAGAVSGEGASGSSSSSAHSAA